MSLDSPPAPGRGDGLNMVLVLLPGVVNPAAPPIDCLTPALGGPSLLVLFPGAVVEGVLRPPAVAGFSSIGLTFAALTKIPYLSPLHSKYCTPWTDPLFFPTGLS